MNDSERRSAYLLLENAVQQLREAHPDLLTAELVELLDEPDRSRGRVLLQATTPPGGLFIERVNRQPWHISIERAISVRIRTSDFDLDAILADAGIAPDAVERPEAEMYAYRLVEALARCPAQPVMAQPSDRPQ